MKELIEQLKNFRVIDAKKIEREDRQFIALEHLGKTICDKNVFLSLVIGNSIICYQLSGKGEDYWEEFGEYFSNTKVNILGITEELIKFLKRSKNNRRLQAIKEKRLLKIRKFLRDFDAMHYYKDMKQLNRDLALELGQKEDAKTIVFAVKMFYYGGVSVYGDIVLSKNISIPIDSRLEKIFDLYHGDYIDIKKFYSDLGDTLNIPPLHLDAILWTKYEELTNTKK